MPSHQVALHDTFHIFEVAIVVSKVSFEILFRSPASTNIFILGVIVSSFTHTEVAGRHKH